MFWIKILTFNFYEISFTLMSMLKAVRNWFYKCLLWNGKLIE